MCPAGRRREETIFHKALTSQSRRLPASYSRTPWSAFFSCSIPKKALPASTKAWPKGCSTQNKHTRNIDYIKDKRSKLTCSSQVVGREDDAVTSGITTAFSTEAAGAVGATSGCRGASTARGEATRQGETVSSLGGLARSSASLYKQKTQNLINCKEEIQR